MLIDDFSSGDFVSKLGTRWRGVSDQVMGGISEASVAQSIIDGRPCLRFTCDVRLENDGGFIQAVYSTSRSRAIRSMHPASPACACWYAATASDTRFTCALPITCGRGNPTGRTSPQDQTGQRSTFLSKPSRLIDSTRHWTSRGSRVGLVAIGRAIYADLAISELSLYR